MIKALPTFPMRHAGHLSGAQMSHEGVGEPLPRSGAGVGAGVVSQLGGTKTRGGTLLWLEMLTQIHGGTRLRLPGGGGGRGGGEKAGMQGGAQVRGV